MLARAGLALFAALLAGGCTTRLYEGPALPPDQVAVIHVGATIVRQIDGQGRRGGPLDAGEFEVTPGPHRVALVFELPARNLGVKILPAKSGVGTCVIEFTAEAGKQYYLGSRPRGDMNNPRWDGAWEAWLRDPTVSSEDDVIARCEPQLVVARATRPPKPAPPTPTPLPAAATAPAAVAPAPAAAVPPAAAPSDGMVRIGFWTLGAQNDRNAAASAIEAHFDLVAFGAVQQADYEALLGSLGPAWNGITAAQYAVVYRRQRIQPCTASARSTPECFDAEAVDIGFPGQPPIAIRVRDE